MPSEIAQLLRRTKSSSYPLPARTSRNALRLMACGLMLALLAGCHRGHLHPRPPHRVLVPVPPHIDVHGHGVSGHGHKHGHKHKHKHAHDDD